MDKIKAKISDIIDESSANRAAAKHAFRGMPDTGLNDMRYIDKLTRALIGTRERGETEKYLGLVNDLAARTSNVHVISQVYHEVAGIRQGRNAAPTRFETAQQGLEDLKLLITHR